MNNSRVAIDRSTATMNSIVGRLARHGVSLLGSRQLAVRGRASGEWRTTPVNPLTLDGDRYLVAPRGETQWVKNMRVAGGGELRLGRSTEAFRASELDDTDKVPVLREYMRKWRWEVGAFFPGLGVNSEDATIAAAAASYPVFRIVPAQT
ncbi:nitroreductase/quinone reductase family protein [Tsukamurella sp. 8F]|uniref:nitroreductase/quinone reductase family protein n=1 Tax=unclassified Tsukamurella TaxID=2633480 RepID=UPI0023B901A9|nr:MULTISPECIES: nitroreductase/quinone reductase family protein [unclassified Tsukamurella]MDF0532153.1 nitroreductase/quinone reductase family protein [Tsukamurella sp. 8J]MDF0589437.1 nitroreductase/quinone reductase family protein [Tsukamurella sp. 8F]